MGRHHGDHRRRACRRNYGDRVRRRPSCRDHYGAGRFPVSYSKGRVTPSAKITVEMGEVIGWQAKSPTGRLQDLAPFPIVVAYIPEDGQIVIDKIMNCPFQEERPQLERGGHAAARRSRAGALAYQVAQQVTASLTGAGVTACPFLSSNLWTRTTTPRRSRTPKAK